MPPMLHSRTVIEEGDLVIIFMSRDNMTAINVKRGEYFHNKFGRYKHDDMIGMKFGSKSGYIHLLRPTPELWTLSLPHRTQILYMPDIAYIIMRLGVRVGGTVLEAGTGSGSMTHSMSRTVGPKGTVHSCEYHRARFEKAGEEFEEHGLNNVRLQHRNVCKDGFGDVEGAEAVFLDLPAPWEAIPHAVKILKITRICCFSPCMEQVLKTATALRAEGFVDVSTQEVLTRTYDLIAPPPQDSHHLASVSAVAADLRDHERRKEERRVQQMRNARERSRAQKAAKEAKEAKEAAAKAGEEVTEGVAGESGKRKLDETDEPADKAAKVPRVGDSEAAVELELGEDGAVAIDVDGDAEVKAEVDAEPEGEDEPVPTQESYEAEYAARYAEPTTAWGSMVLTKPSPEMRGHTSYLTFATFYPAAIREQIAEQDSVAPTGAVTAATTEAATREGSVRA